MKQLLLLATLALPLTATAQVRIELNRDVLEVQPGVFLDSSHGGFGNNESFIVGEAGPTKPDPQGADLLRFQNGDIIHGTFSGLTKNELTWKRKDLAAPIQFNTFSLSQVAFNGGKIREGLIAPSRINLSNGDRLPGTIVAMDDLTLTVETPMAGPLQIPRESISSIFPRPQGGGLLYAGPFNSDGWKILAPEQSNQDKGKKINPDDFWVHSGAAWYSKSEAPLVREVNLPDRARISFKLGWRNRLGTSIIFHSNFKRPITQAEPENPEDPEKPALKWETLPDQKAGLTAIPWTTNSNSRTANPHNVGSAYVLTFQSSYPTLYRCSFDENGRPNVQSIQTARAPINFGNMGEAEIDLRIDRLKKSIALYINGDYTMQWDENANYVGQGSSIGFTANNNCHIRISDLVVSPWNGMKDSARSMSHDERDVLLLTNGTDRFSGLVETIQDGKVSIKTTYSSMQIPLDQIEEIHFHGKEQKATFPEDAALLLFGKNGRLTLSPSSATSSKITGTSPLLGEINLGLESATLLQFSPGNAAIDTWNEIF